MQQPASTSTSGGGFFSSLGSVFIDALDEASSAAIRDQFGENESEQPEGPTEFGNPNTVSQPVRQSQLPSGQSLNGVAASLGVPVSALVIGIVLLLVILLRRK